jgi:hypothetical protein
MDLFSNAGGNEAWAIRSAAVFFTSGTLALIYALTRRVTQNEGTALFAALICLATPAFWVGSVLVTVDPLLIFFWTLTLYSFYRASQGEPRMWLLAGLGLGFGMLSKYTMVLLPIAFFGYILLHDRRWLRHWGPYAMLFIGGVMNLGVLHWNWQHDWISFRHTAAIGASGAWNLTDSIQNLAEYVGGQAGVAGPVLFLFFLYAGFQTARAARRSPDAALLAWAFWTLLVFYAAVSFSRSPEANWPVCAYIAAAPILARWYQQGPRRKGTRQLLAVGLVLGCLLGLATRTSGIIYTLGSPVDDEPGSIRIAGMTIDSDRDPTNQLQGGRELGAALTVLRGSASSKPFVFSDRYQLTALAAFYTRGQPRALCANFGNRRFNQYDLWNEWDEVTGQDGLYISGGDRWRARYFIQHMVELGAFRSGEPLEEVRVYRGGILVRTFTISRMNGYSGYRWLPSKPAY